MAKTGNDGRSVIICHVAGDEAILASSKGREVIARGREYWLNNVRYPVLVIDALVPVVGR